MARRLLIAGSLLPLIVLLAVMAACSAQQPEPVVHNLTIATGNTGGTYYPVGEAMAGIWESSISGLTVTPRVTGGSVENLRLLAAGQVELALAQNNTADYAFRGVSRDFEDGPLSGFRAIGVIYPEVVQILARPEIERVEDLAGKRVIVGPPGSGTEASAREILGVYGLHHVEDEENRVNFEAHFLTVDESAEAFRDSHVDAVFLVMGVPSRLVQEIAAQQPYKLLDITGEPLEKIRAEYPFYAPIEVPAGTYPNQEEPFQAVSLQATLFVRAELDLELVYQMTKVLYEDYEKADIQRALDGITVPLHPGAGRYYRETGLIDGET